MPGPPPGGADSLAQVARDVVACERCPRLRGWCRKVAREKVKRFRDEEYWGRPVPGFGDARARLLVVGLAPAAHGANRTGRVFTGDRSGDFLFAGLHRAGFASQPESTGREDGLALRDCYVTPVGRCAPPQNRPTPAELGRCRALSQQNTFTGRLTPAGFDAVLQAAKSHATEGRRAPAGRKPR